MEPDIVPPPPYSETDIYSNAGTSPHPILTPAASHSDNLSVATRPLPSTASSVDETVYTPLYSPAGSIHQNQVFGDDLDHVSSSSATAYFESRPAHGFSSSSEVIRLSVTSRTEPKDLPFPQNLLPKDVNEQDWATFVNYLLPDHTVGVNNDVADRKLKAELIDERMHRLTLGQDDRSRTDLHQVDAQLDPLRQPQSQENSTRLNRLEATISEWNEGFFNPRGVQISNINLDVEVAAGEEATRMPGSWIPWEHEMNPESSTSNNAAGRRGFFSGFMQAGSQGFKMGPIVADNDGFRIGKNGLRADNNGFRLGNMLVADSNGFRLGGSRGFNADGHGLSLGGRSWGRRESQDHDTGRGRGRHHPRRGRSHSHERHRRRRGRSSSTSSSSSSSSSSSESDASVGSLQDYEDLKDQQLPVAKQSLMDWLNHPDQPITKETVQHMRQDIKLARKDSSKQMDEDLKAMRNEVKDLMKIFKDGKKAQKKQRKEERRERRAVRKAEKRERRNARKEERKSKREEKKCRRGGARTGPPWMASRFPGHPGFAGPSPPGCMVPPMQYAEGPPSSMPGFPFGRSASAPFAKGLPFGRGWSGPPGMSAMHGGWPFTQHGPYAPGGVSAPQNTGFPTPVSDSAEQLHKQARQMEEAAERKESRAIDIRTAATGGRVSEKEKLKMKDEATKLEEEADNYRREVERLRAEALHLDGELARELEEEHRSGQVTGVIPGSYVH